MQMSDSVWTGNTMTPLMRSESHLANEYLLLKVACFQG